MASLETREPKTKTQQSILAAVVTLLANGLWFWVAGALDELGLVWQSYQPGVAIVIGWAAIGAIGMPLLFSERHRPLGRGVLTVTSILGVAGIIFAIYVVAPALS